MKMKKSVLASVMALVSAFSFVGCVGGGNANDTETDVLQLAIVNKGYGVDFLQKLIDGFEAKTGREAEIVKQSTEDSYVRTSLKTPKTNGIDVYFAIEDFVDDLIFQGKSVVSGYDCVFEDLSPLYDEKLEGWGDNATMKTLLNDFHYTANTYQATGKQYTVTWATGTEGLIYNYKLFQEHNIPLPRTTDELFEVMDLIKSKEVKTSQGALVYPFTYPGKNDYMYYLSNVWFAQYDGTEAFNNFLQGKNASGEYTPDIALEYEGLLEAYSVIERMLFVGNGKDVPSNGYVNTADMKKQFTDAQVLFLKGNAFMMPNGDWLDREANTNFAAGSVDVRYMKTPIISAIKDKLSTVSTDAVLREVVDYVDGKTTTKPAGVSDDDIAYVRKARNVVNAETGHVCFIPVYSNNKELAKDFLLYMYSKEGQEIVSQYSYGNTAPLKVDYTTLSNYNNLTQLQKSKFAIMENATFVGRRYNNVMNFRGGLRVFHNACESRFGISSNSESYKTAEDYILEMNAHYEGNWDAWMKNAGLK